MHVTRARAPAADRDRRARRARLVIIRHQPAPASYKDASSSSRTRVAGEVAGDDAVGGGVPGGVGASSMGPMLASTLVLLSHSSAGPPAPARLKQADLPVMVHIDWQRAPDIPKQGSTKSGFQDSDGGWLDDTTVLTAFGYSSGGIPGFLNTAWVLNSSLLGSVAVRTSSAPNTTCGFELGGECSHGYKPVMCYTARRLFPTGCAALSCHGVASVCDGATGFCVTNSTPKTQPCISQTDPPPPPPPSPPAGAGWQQLPSAPVCGRQEVSAAIVDGAAYYVGGFSYIPGPSKTHPYCFNDTLKLSR